MHLEDYTTDELLRLSLQEAFSLSTAETVPDEVPASTLDQFLKIEQAARILSVSKSWLYQHRDKLPFMVRLPDGPLRVSVSKLQEWMGRSTP